MTFSSVLTYVMTDMTSKSLFRKFPRQLQNLLNSKQIHTFQDFNYKLRIQTVNSDLNYFFYGFTPVATRACAYISMHIYQTLFEFVD